MLFSDRSDDETRKGLRMPMQKHPFQPGGPTRIEISWGLAWRDFTVRFDGKAIGTVSGGMAALKKGVTFNLSDGSVLGIKLVTSTMTMGGLPDLQVSRNGTLLPGTGADPAIRLRNSYQLIYLIGGLNIVLGIVAEVGKVAFLRELGISWFSIIFGLVIAGLGYLVQQRSKVALGLVIALLIVDAVVGLLPLLATSQYPPIGGLFARGVFIVMIARGWAAIQELETQTPAT